MRAHADDSLLDLDLQERHADLGAIDGGGHEAVLREEAPALLEALFQLVVELALVLSVLCLLLQQSQGQEHQQHQQAQYHQTQRQTD